MTVELVKRISNIDNFVQWAEQYRNALVSGQYRSAFKRKYLELGWRCEKGHYTQVHDDERAYAIAAKAGCPNARIFLLCLYEQGGGIKPHRDDTGYGKTGYALSSTDYIFQHGGNTYQCKAGEVYKFPTKVLHGVPPLQSERWALLWWEPDWRCWNDQFKNVQLPVC